jgi:nickel-type superoxide dismutase maturation protease
MRMPSSFFEKGVVSDITSLFRPSFPVVVGVAAALAVLVGVGRWCRRVIVHGDSMAPALLAGDRVLVVAGGRLRRGDIVAVPDPRRPHRLLIKRVTHLAPGRDTVSLAGDNAAASTDSRTFGPVPRRAILGRAVYRYAPVERAGRIGHFPPP